MISGDRAGSSSRASPPLSHSEGRFASSCQECSLSSFSLEASSVALLKAPSHTYPGSRPVIS
jgi:hypothetical protein